MKIDEGSDQTSDIWPHWMASHARLKNEFTEDNKYHNLMTWLIHRVNRRLGVQSEVDKIKEDILKMEEEKNKCNKELRSLKEEASRIHVQNTLDEIKEIEQDLCIAHKRRAAICAKARNDYSAQEIKKDFKAGLREMKRQARVQEDEEEDEEEEENEEDNNIADSLQIFCCSATEYQKIQNPLPDDGPPNLFSDAKETQVPQLRNYVHKVARERKRQAMDTLISSLCRLVADVQHIITNSTLKNDVVDTCNEYVNKSNTELRRIKTTFSNDIEGSFGGISNKLTEGAKVAEKQATNTCCRWGSTSTSSMSTSSARHPAKGYPFNTYMAAVHRHGEFRSPTYGYINFNEDLTNPILKQQAIVWDRVFNHEINEITVKVVNDAFNIITKLAEEMQEKVVRAGFSDTKEEEMLYKITNRLSEMSRVLHFKISSEQRELSRSITPPIQSNLKSTYARCSTERGKGMFLRVKNKINADIESLKDTMFLTAVENIIKRLDILQATAIQDVEHACALLVEDLKTGLKLRTVTQTAANGALLTALKNCAKMLRPKTSSSSCQFPQDTREFIGPRNDKQNSNTQPSRAAIVGAFQTTGATNTVSPHKRKQDFDDNYKDTKREKPGL